MYEHWLVFVGIAVPERLALITKMKSFGRPPSNLVSLAARNTPQVEARVALSSTPSAQSFHVSATVANVVGTSSPIFTFDRGC